ncbi:L-histidine N(alpha)-methyltransferase [Gordonia soli]|uniref:Histidine-specific methyltransferase SAM-dependent domain-containing protein n=1 Tax=Gordonia soli NBRC 108243 TaxID=1223545 RepID=M0QPX1_9ACTN|nr:L-histidine N(alpha)-methyltransferase [Gordonia soli]GAC70628.1 hypothetical protein GS4_38_00340 [Gordonia soli NBRC 108243]
MTTRPTTVDIDDPLATDVLAGLWQDPPTLPTKWLYDERGSRLFDEITRLPEYYPTRRETEILRAHGAEIAASTDASTLVEFGSGTSTKTRLLLTAFADRHSDAAAGVTERPRYVPLDVSAEILAEASATLAVDYPSIDITPQVADFTADGLTLPDADGPLVAAFLGSTIGNFDTDGREKFLSRLSSALRTGDFLLLGADLIKDTGRLLAAYDDRAGVTADFSRNMIEVLRTGLDTTGLYAGDFDHVARWNPREHRMEMSLRARRDVVAWFGVLQKEWRASAGTEIATEISTKFDRAELTAELARAGLTEVRTWTDGARDFALVLARR